MSTPHRQASREQHQAAWEQLARTASRLGAHDVTAGDFATWGIEEWFYLRLSVDDPAALEQAYRDWLTRREASR